MWKHLVFCWCCQDAADRARHLHTKAHIWFTGASCFSSIHAGERDLWGAWIFWGCWKCSISLSQAIGHQPWTGTAANALRWATSRCCSTGDPLQRHPLPYSNQNPHFTASIRPGNWNFLETCSYQKVTVHLWSHSLLQKDWNHTWLPIIQWSFQEEKNTKPTVSYKIHGILSWVVAWWISFWHVLNLSKVWLKALGYGYIRGISKQADYRIELLCVSGSHTDLHHWKPN